MSIEEVLEDLRENIYCRIKSSQGRGVGVFAIRGIPSGIDPFPGTPILDYARLLEKQLSDDPTMPEGVKEMVRDFCVTEDGAYLIPTQTLNLLNISFFVNHSSEAPNLEAREEKGDMTFYTLRDIKEGEELLVDYRTYSDDWK